MNTNTIVVTIVGLIVIIGGMFAAAQFLSPSHGDNDVESPNDEVPADADMYPGITRVDAKQFFVDGEHTFAGELLMPTPCDLLEVDAVVRESMPEQIHLSFTVINTAEACAQVMTPQRFMVTTQASADATVTADFMGRDIEINLIEPEPGETPDDFELFIKG